MIDDALKEPPKIEYGWKARLLNGGQFGFMMFSIFTLPHSYIIAIIACIIGMFCAMEFAGEDYRLTQETECKSH